MGVPAFVVSHGDDTAGAIIVKVNKLNGDAILFERSAATSREGTVIIIPKLFQLGPAISRLPKTKSIFSISFSTKSANL